MDKYAPPKELWDAPKCARILGYKDAEAFKYHVRKGVLPPPVDFIGLVAQWDAAQLRRAVSRMQEK